MAQNMENIDFHTFFTVTSQQWSLLEENCDFLSSFEHFWPDPQDTLSKVALSFKKMYKVLKHKAQECSTPLNMNKLTISMQFISLENLFSTLPSGLVSKNLQRQ